MPNDVEGQIMATLTDLEARGIITSVERRAGALGDPRLTDIYFELGGEPFLLMIASQAPEQVRIVGDHRELDVPRGQVERTLLEWPRP